MCVEKIEYYLFAVKFKLLYLIMLQQNKGIIIPTPNVLISSSYILLYDSYLKIKNNTIIFVNTSFSV